METVLKFIYTPDDPGEQCLNDETHCTGIHLDVALHAADDRLFILTLEAAALNYGISTLAQQDLPRKEDLGAKKDSGSLRNPSELSRRERLTVIEVRGAL